MRTIKTTVPVGLFLASLILFTTPKTPNSGWMGQYVAPNFPPIFTGIPVFRLWIPVEEIEFQLLGQLWISNNLSYALLGFCVLYILFLEALRLKALPIYIITLLPLSVVMYFAARGGPLYDIAFALSLLIAIVIISRVPQEASWQALFGLGLCLSVIDHSRPTGMYFVLMFLAFALYWYKAKRWLLVGVLLTITLPFHIHQWMTFGTFNLTTYAGANLREVFTIGRDCVNEGGAFGSGFGGIDTKKFADCSNETQSTILSEIRHKPSSLYSAMTPMRVRQVLLPNPYWHGTGLNSDLHSSYWIRLYEFSLICIYIAALFTIRINPKSLLAAAVLIFGFTTTLFAHSGFEAVRVFMPFIVFAVWMSFSVPGTVPTMRNVRKRGSIKV